MYNDDASINVYKKYLKARISAFDCYIIKSEFIRNKNYVKIEAFVRYRSIMRYFLVL